TSTWTARCSTRARREPDRSGPVPVRSQRIRRVTGRGGRRVRRPCGPVQPSHLGGVPRLVGEHNALHPVGEGGKPLVDVPVGEFAPAREKLPAGMLELSLQLVEQTPALAYLRLQGAGRD